MVLVVAAEKYADNYRDDDRQGIVTDVLNAFYAGAKYGHAAERERLALLAESRTDGWHSLTAAEIRVGRVGATGVAMSKTDQSSAADRGSALTDLLGVAAETVDDGAARRIGLYPDGSGGYTLEFHTIWLPEFDEAVTQVRLTKEAVSLLSTAVIQALHSGAGYCRL